MSLVEAPTTFDRDAHVISVLSIVAALVNLFLMITILVSPSLRTSSKHILIFVLCLTDVYKGVVEFPLLAQLYSLEKWVYDEHFLKALDFSAYILMLSLRTNIIYAICLNCILSMLTTDKRTLILLSVSMLMASLGYSIMYALPVSSGSPTPDPSDSCYWKIIETMDTIKSGTFVFPQTSIMIVLIVDIIILSCGKEEPRNIPSDVILACVLMQICLVPFRIAHIHFHSCREEDECKPMSISRGDTGLREYITPCLMPLVWLMCRKTRKCILNVYCCRREDAEPTLTKCTPSMKQCEKLSRRNST